MKSTPKLPDAVVEKKNEKLKRHSITRKTVCYEKPPINMANSSKCLNTQNTEPNMYATNSLYRSLCVLCSKKKNNIVAHYVRDHPAEEVFISRPTPKMAQIIRKSIISFQSEGGKLTGNCVFCEETKTFQKNGWAQHLLTHTGEKTFFCTICNSKFKSLSDHSKMCAGEPSNIYLSNSTRDVVAFMCFDCNYIQFGRDNMIKHMKNEHGYLRCTETLHYGKVTLVSSLSKVSMNNQK